jgi:hypothetical protein
MRDLQRWMDEDKKRGRAGRSAQLITGRGENAAKDTTRAENYLVDAQGLCRQPLHELQGRMDAHGHEWRRSDGLSARPRAGVAGDDGLRPARAEGRAGDGVSRSISDAAPDASFAFRGELAAVSGYYAAKIAAVRRGLKPSDIAAVVRAIQNEQTLAVRAVLDRWGAASRAAIEKRQAKSASFPHEARAPMRPLAGRQPS